VKEPGSLEGRGDRRPSRPVWAAAQGLKGAPIFRPHQKS